jgi:hypothetical protein
MENMQLLKAIKEMMDANQTKTLDKMEADRKADREELKEMMEVSRA